MIYSPPMRNKPRQLVPHFHGAPCGRCRGTLRYVTTRSCVPCAKRSVAKRRGTPIPEMDYALVGSHDYDDIDDLLGDI